MRIEDVSKFTSEPGSHASKPGDIKRKAAFYLGMQLGEALTRYELKQVTAKAHKLKDSRKKAERQMSHQLVRYIG